MRRIERHWPAFAIFLMLALIAAPVAVRACMPGVNASGMFASGIIDVTQELPGGG